jgi:cell division cycle 14
MTCFDLVGPILHEVVDGRLLIAQNTTAVLTMKSVHCFRLPAQMKYHPFCDDFGPMSMLSIFRFVKLLENEMTEFPTKKIVFYVEEGDVLMIHLRSTYTHLCFSASGKRELTNAVFLLGAYLILVRDMLSEEVVEIFEWIDSNVAVPYRDASFVNSDFDLTLLDCWKGLEQGKELGWVACPTTSNPMLWGQIDERILEHYDDPANGDLHEIIPNCLYAFRGPVHIAGQREYFDDKHGHRLVSPHFYARAFLKLGITAVVRLNEPRYDPRDFEAHGIAHHDLAFDDCTPPPARIVRDFLRVAASSPGGVAVHCKAGLGRTGTLIALYMMRHHGFAARHAMAWVRIMRPGSVIGPQQHYLCAVEESAAVFAAVAAGDGGGDGARSARGLPGAASRAPPGREDAASASASASASSSSFSSSAAAAAAAAAAAEQVARGMRRRDASRAQDRAPGPPPSRPGGVRWIEAPGGGAAAGQRRAGPP